MGQFERLLEIADRLLGPDGCPWDREQTLYSLQPYLLEEVHELIEAIDLGDFQKISEELGDVFYALVFVAKLAENQQKFTVDDALEGECEKLIRRHPHVFGELKVSSTEEIVTNWEEIKKKEKSQEMRKGLFDGIPPSLPTLPRAQKMAKKVRKRTERPAGEKTLGSEERLGELLWLLIAQGESEGLDAEGALRRKLHQIEKEPESGSRHEGHP